MRPFDFRMRGLALLGLVTGCGLLAAVVILASFQPSRAQNESGPIVSVTGGLVQGQLLPVSGGAVFKAIPYAAPPVGDLRWREPQPVKSWAGVRQAVEYGADCPAVVGGLSYSAVAGGSLNQGGPVPMQNPRPVGERAARPTSEDCLFLNVWTPAWPAAGKKAVMVWLHGDELAGGTGALRSGPAEQAESSLARHGVIVVSVNFRGNLLGMMGHPELTAESPHHASGNYVLLDQIAALRWVHANITRFGGDPNNVTIFGQSGGGRSVSMLVASPLAKGLVHRAIMESGAATDSVRPYLTQVELEKIGVALAETLKAPASDAIKYLRSLPVLDIMAAMPEVRRRLDSQNLLAFDEGIDGYMIPQSPAEVFRSHTELRIPIMVGQTARDTGLINAANPLRPTASPEEVKAWMKGVLEVFYAKYPDLLAKAMKAYGFDGEPNDISAYPPYGTPEQQEGIDMNHRCGAVVTALWHSSVAPTYEFEFSRTTPARPPVHTAELPFVFGYLSNDDLNDETALRLRDQMQQYWTNFAKTGNPNGPGLPVWMQYSASAKPSMEFTNDGPVARNAIRAMACAPYTEKFNREPNLMVGGDHQQLRPGNVK